MQEKREKNWGELIIPSLAILYTLYTLGKQMAAGYQFSTTVYGLLLGIPVVLCSILIMLGVLIKVKTSEQDDPVKQKETRINYQRSLALLIGIIALISLLNFLGYFLGILIYLIILLWYLKVRSWHILFSVSLGTSLVIHMIFAVWLKLPLPVGLLKGLL
ncbi:MAG: tripartite tricarboxylate transporter TctB family protein [Peptococcaceae bacterium]